MAVLHGRFRLEELHLFRREETDRVTLMSEQGKEWVDVMLKDAQEFAKFPVGTEFEVTITPVETARTT